ncbi:hypothetical protein KIH41_11080 [Litoribacter ruber]|uniref:Uncharacterized protein n=1 Tax=Litoribacter ruber TaxID=702568 RepID=A0AAP2G206_9BACT|nr:MULTISPECIES: hypothetical protein [Litoribacter]MBS9525022.1 hypothetical protein [Litoribacter alkaliphilus]MBT0811820.1 hypothetical protein [Litoribacter ruber]
MKATQFEETQRFRQPWIWMLLGVLTLYVGYEVAINWDQNKTFTQAYPLLVVISVLLLFLTMRLQTRVVNGQLFYKYTPIINSWRKYSFDEIETMELITYNSLLQFGGWGIRFNADAWLYNVAGKHGIKVVTAKQKFIIGTSKPEEAALIIEQFKAHKHAK